MRKILFLSVLIFIALISCKKRTDSVISGKITDAETGKPVQGINVVLSANTQKTKDDPSITTTEVKSCTTDVYGNYYIEYEYIEGNWKYQGYYIDVPVYLDSVYTKCEGAGYVKKKKDTKSMRLYK
jgi:hypothetical protein